MHKILFFLIFFCNVCYGSEVLPDELSPIKTAFIAKKDHEVLNKQGDSKTQNPPLFHF